MKRQTFVAAVVMIVQADIFVAGATDQNRSGDEFVPSPAAAAAEAALAHIGQRMVSVRLGIGLVGGTGVATIIEGRNIAAVQEGRVAIRQR